MSGLVSLPIKVIGNRIRIFGVALYDRIGSNSVLHGLAFTLFESVQFQTESRQDSKLLVGLMSHLKKVKYIFYRQHTWDAVWNDLE